VTTVGLEYAVKMEISDSNTLNDLKNIIVDLNAEQYSDDTHGHAQYSWTPAGGWVMVVNGTTTWDSANDVATVSVDGSLSTGQIYLKDNNGTQASAGSYEQTSGYSTIANFGSDTEVPTPENGDIKDIYVWLTTASEGLLPGTYGANYYVAIANA
jgi:hypothetical protein